MSDETSEYLLFFAQNEILCVEILINMEHCNNLESVQRAKGVSYRNAEFRGLTYDIQKNTSGEIQFIFKNTGRIID